MTAPPTRRPTAGPDPTPPDARVVTIDGLAALGQSAAARTLGVTRQHVALMIRRGDLRAIRLGRRVLIPAAEIARLLGGDL